MKQIDPIKKEKYKQARLKGKDKKNSMLEAGYALNTAIQAPAMSIVKQSEKELMEAVKASDVTVEWVVEGLTKELVATDAKASDRIRVRELLGKWLKMFQDVQNTQVIAIFKDIEDEATQEKPIDVSTSTT